MSNPGSGGPPLPGEQPDDQPRQPGAGGQPYGPQPTTPMPPVPPGPPYGRGAASPPYGQPAYGQPAYGQPGYGQPGYGQPPVPPGFGPPVPPGYGTPGGRPPGSGDSNRTAVIAAAVVVALLLLGGVLLVLLRSDHKAKSSANPTDSIARSDSASGFPSSTPGDSTPPTSSDFPTDAAPGGSGSVSEADAKSVVGQYLDDINAQDRNHAATLICPEIVDKWRSSIDQPSGDFTVTITDRTYQGSATNDPGLDVKYLLSVKDRNSAKTGSSTVTFTVVDEGGAKICGEK